VDYDETFSLMAEMASIRLMLALAIAYDLEVEKMDMKTTFFNGKLKEEISMKQPKGFVIEGREDMVFHYMDWSSPQHSGTNGLTNMLLDKAS